MLGAGIGLAVVGSATAIIGAAYMVLGTTRETPKPPPQAFTMGETPKPPPQAFTMRAPAILLILVAGLVGCQFGPSSGSLHYEGSDPMGPFSGEVSAWDCHASFVNGALGEVYFAGMRRGDLISLVPDLVDPTYPTQSVHVLTRGGGWELDRSTCRTFDVRKWLDGDMHVHVVVVLGDCTSRNGGRVQGRVQSDACSVARPR
jgi:hypothetical protein